MQRVPNRDATCRIAVILASVHMWTCFPSSQFLTNDTCIDYGPFYVLGISGRAVLQNHNHRESIVEGKLNVYAQLTEKNRPSFFKLRFVRALRNCSRENLHTVV